MSKKKELSPDFRAECDAAKALFISRKNGLGLTQAKLAEAAEISPAGVAMYLNGTNPLNAKFASVLSRMIGLPVEAFSSRLAKEIAQITQAAPPEINNKTSEKAGTYLAAKAMENEKIDAAMALFQRATPRSQAIISRITELEAQGKLTAQDLKMLAQIIERFGA
jgi:transcriptional regulator with XRE-family HTH domain